MTRFQCLNCGKCCGPVFCSPAEWSAIVAHIKASGVIPIAHTDELTCPLLGLDGLCMVYEVRPTLCRLHGHVPRMACPNNPEADMMGPRDERAACEGLPNIDVGILLLDEAIYEAAGIAVAKE